MRESFDGNLLSTVEYIRASVCIKIHPLTFPCDLISLSTHRGVSRSEKRDAYDRSDEFMEVLIISAAYFNLASILSRKRNHFHPLKSR